MERSDKLDKIAPAMLELQKNIEKVKKDARGHHGMYATLASCIDEVIHKANDCGITITQWGEGQALSTMMLHESGQFITGSLDLILKSLDPQQQGGAITYARRYMLSAAVSLAVEDDDGQAATDQARGQQDKQPAPQPTPAAPPPPASTPPTAAPPAASGAVISEAQLRRLYAIAQGDGGITDRAVIKEWVFGQFGHDDLIKITKGPQYEAVIEWAKNPGTAPGQESQDPPMMNDDDIPF